MTLAMLLVLISHHKGLTLLLIVIIALLFIALTPLVKKLLSHLHDRPEFSFMTAYRGPSLRHLRLSRHPFPQHTVCGNARKRNENHYHKSCANVSAQQ
ncbi:Uncharacterised protein [Klebsiella pneumoniae]|nr:Uncharacterised protein [Klebsiella pneumoniae]